MQAGRTKKDGASQQLFTVVTPVFVHNQLRKLPPNFTGGEFIFCTKIANINLCKYIMIYKYWIQLIQKNK